MYRFTNLILIIISVLILYSCDESTIADVAINKKKPTQEVIDFDRSQHIIINRDELGVPNIHGKTDGDTAFGLGYSQAEDNFAELEFAYIISIGRAAEILGEEAILSDWVVHSFENSELSKRNYENASPKIKALLEGYANGINYYIDTHPNLERRLLEHIEPWYALALIRRWYYIGEYIGQLGYTYEERIAAFEAINGSSQIYSMQVTPNYYPISRKVFNRISQSANWSNIEKSYVDKFINPYLPANGVGQAYKINMVSNEGWNLTGYVRFGHPLPFIGFNENLDWVSRDNNSNHEDKWYSHFDENDNSLRFRYTDTMHNSNEWSSQIKIKGHEDRILKYRKTHLGVVIAKREGEMLSSNFVPYESPFH